jgi:ABC-2 type transport system ATP-binding protein
VNQAGYYGIDRVHATKDAEKFLKLLGLWEKRNTPSRSLSGGMKRRLMIARSLIHHPRMLILDEPTAGVDIELRRGMWDFLRDLTSQGITIILTTHYLEEAEQLCKNLAIIDRGQIIEKGSIRQLLSKLDVQTFIFDLTHEPDANLMRELNAFKPKKIDGMSIEINIAKDQVLNTPMQIISAHNINIKSMRTKSNRLEELFVTLTAPTL